MTVGTRLVAAALMPMQAVGLSNRARLVLVRMCATARDVDQPPVYYGGWPHLSEPLGFVEYDDAAKTAVKRAVRELVAVGLVKAVGVPGPGHNVTYEIRL